MRPSDVKPNPISSSRTYAIGDVHGCYDTLRGFFDRFGITDEVRVIFCGDLADRGPKIRETLDFVLGRKNSVILIGNHDYAFIDSVKKDGRDRNFYMLSEGLRETLQQLGDESRKYARRLSKLGIYSYEDPAGMYVFCHADYNWRDGEPFSPDDHLWNRLDAQSHREYDGPIIVHGHTPCERARVFERKGSPPKTFAINLDGGCVYGDELPWACLRGLRLEDGEILEHECVDELITGL
jgi:serine/threonine protein phosphatase 1